MSSNVTLGGERLGSGKKQKVYLHGYNRSTHELGYLWRSSMSAGTLVPFMSEIALPGDTFDIDLGCDVMTLPTIGPLFGSYKVQLDVFSIPIRLYNSLITFNNLNIGMDMSKVFLPRMNVVARDFDDTKPIDNQQISSSCLLRYLGVSGIGYEVLNSGSMRSRFFNAVPLLAYWDIYKNYYANKQEGVGAYIHYDADRINTSFTGINYFATSSSSAVALPQILNTSGVELTNLSELSYIVCEGGSFRNGDENAIYVDCTITQRGITYRTILPLLFNGTEGLFEDYALSEFEIVFRNPYRLNGYIIRVHKVFSQFEFGVGTPPDVKFFDLENIDQMRLNILRYTGGIWYTVDDNSQIPYGDLLGIFEDAEGNDYNYSSLAQEGLGIKTYQSDLFNNWLDTEFIDGTNGVGEVTRVDTSTGGFTIDELNLKSKVYVMLNRIAMSGGTYDDWLMSVYDSERINSIQNPVYEGGLIKELVFQEVVSNAASNEQPLGTLAGRGRLGGKHKGGQVTVKVKEPSYIMGIASITPRVDYSQGNKWDMNLLTFNDFHKPQLDEIGFQDLITDQMAYFDTKLDGGGEGIFKSAGKVPAWLNYMTNVNKVYGSFADENDSMFMVLNRRYEGRRDSSGEGFEIKDLTTYIDPSKFNHIFANTRRDAMNFWVQIACDITARRVMSAKVIPNL